VRHTSDPISIAKPREGQPCNGCGLCCQMELCGIGVMAFPGASAPCPALRFNGSLYRCALVETETAAGAPPVMAEALGIGKGCCSSDDDAT
jgi:hypothetical protein